MTDIRKVRVKAAACHDTIFEFGIRLDYGSEIELDAVFARSDTEQVKNGTSYRRHRMTKGISRENRRLKSGGC